MVLSLRKRLQSGELDSEIEFEVSDTSSLLPMMDLPGGGQVGMLNLSDHFCKAFGKAQKIYLGVLFQDES